MPDHRSFQQLHRQLRETRSFHVTRHDVVRRRAIRSPSLEESTLSVVGDRPESSTRSIRNQGVVAHHNRDESEAVQFPDESISNLTTGNILTPSICH
ncbi:hypothetical protein TNCV_2953581 [Trichonephila clavipes]|nr:hypothetical protein TNCV_2953581 [Trichonephila clavipes]